MFNTDKGITGGRMYQFQKTCKKYRHAPLARSRRNRKDKIKNGLVLFYMNRYKPVCSSCGHKSRYKIADPIDELVY